jgi:predicted permease
MSLRSFVTRLVSQLQSWLSAVFHPNQLGARMDSELACHLELLTHDLLKSGFPPEEAARRARVALGPMLKHQEDMRASLGLRWWDQLSADLCYGARLLRKSPSFTAVAAVSLALAIGVNTTIFSLARQLLYERLDVPHAENLRLLGWTVTRAHSAVHDTWGDWNKLPDGRAVSHVFSYPVYEQVKAENHTLEDLLAFKETGMNATIRGEAQRVRTEMVSGNYYGALGVRAELGRPIQPSDDRTPGQGTVAVISDGLWEREFGRSSAVLGQTIKLNNIPLTVVGVNPRGFTGAQSTLSSPDVFVPLSMQPLVSPASWNGPDALSELANTREWWVNVMGRIKPGVSEAQAQAALNTQLAAAVRATMPVRPGEDIPVLELQDGSRGLFQQERMYAKPMTVLMTLVALVLLLACANIANLMLARGAQRQREMSVRMALGAGRARIARQMLVESLMLAALGGAGGLLTGYFGGSAIPKLLANGWERSDLQIHFNWMVFAFTAGVTILTGILFGLAPALGAANAEPAHGLKETAQTTTRRRKGIGGKALVGFQIALSMLLVVGAGLFLRTLAGLSSVNVGFRTDHLLLVVVDPPAVRYPEGKDIALHQHLEQAFGAVPGVESVAAGTVPYLEDASSTTDFLPQGETYDQNKGQSENYNLVGDRFFETMGIPIVAGRSFGPQDRRESATVGIINQSLAQRRFPGQNPIGRLFQTSAHQTHGHDSANTKDWIQIVGICGDTSYATLRDAPPPQFFLPYVQQIRVGAMTYAIRTLVNPEAIVPALRRAAQMIDPALPLIDVHTEDQQINADLQQEKLFVVLTSGFGLLALTLAAVGIYGIMAYSVANRRNEIGIRMALGAQPGQVRSMVLRESTWLAAAGIAVGMATALALTRLIQSMLYGIRPYDPITLSAGVGLLFAVAVAATWIPARRAASVQPMDALRHE